MNRYERQVHRLLLAYPAGWREERGEEMVGTILDLAGDGRRRVSLRVAFDLLVGGGPSAPDAICARSSRSRRAGGLPRGSRSSRGWWWR